MSNEMISHDRLVELGREIHSTVAESTGSLTVATARMTHAGHAPVVYALGQHTLRLGSVVLDLYERGLHVEAMPTIRSAYECAITAQWLADSREGVAAWFNEDIRKRQALAKSLAKSASTAHLSADVAHIDHAQLETIAANQAMNFERRCEALSPGGAHAYSIYRILSAFSHPSAMMVDQYLQPADTELGLALRLEPETFEHSSWLALTVSSMVWGARAVDVMRQDSPHRSYLRAAARELGISDVLRLTPEALAAEQRAEKDRRRAGWKPKKP